MEEEIERFTSTLESSAQPSSQARARGPDRLDHLIARVDQMFGILDSLVQHIANQFAYIQGQITALSSQIEDMSVEQGSDLESKHTSRVRSLHYLLAFLTIPVKKWEKILRRRMRN